MNPLTVYTLLWAAIIFFTITFYALFEKAQRPGWAIFIPVYNLWVLVDVAALRWWWFFIAWLPRLSMWLYPDVLPRWSILYLNLTTLLAWAAICYGCAKAFEKGILFALGLFLLPFIFFPALA